MLIPYKTQEIIDDGGLYYGINAISHNLLMCNRKLLLNGNGFIIGVSRFGKVICEQNGDRNGSTVHR